jgi:hypothetical protein
MMNDDLNTHSALQTLYQLSDQILSSSAMGQNVIEAQQTLKKCGKVFGLHLDSDLPEPSVVTGWDQHIQRFRDQVSQGT